jgi:chemotaxis protein methyltransferase CheR
MSGVPVSRWLDLIICRNVTIYFTEQQKDELAKMFHAALVSRGFYIMGKTEYLGRQVENLFASYKPLQKILIRKD